jgi:hypothetical protein
MTARRCIVAGLALLCLGATGCGRAGDRDQAARVTERFFSAVGSGEEATACAQLTPDTRKALEDDERKPCRDAIGGLSIDPGSPTKLELYLTNAKADLGNGESAFLSLTAEGWRLSAVGCKPGAGPPADAPMDCELEA